MIDLRNRKKDIRKFINIIETSIIETLKFYDVHTFSDRDNVGIWVNNNEKIEKIAAIGVRVSKWIAYHGFSLNESVIKTASLLEILSVKTFIYSLLNSKLTFLSFNFFVKVISLPVILLQLLI